MSLHPHLLRVLPRPVVSTDLAAPLPASRDNCTTGFSSGSTPDAEAAGSSSSVAAPGNPPPDPQPGVRYVFIPMDPYDPHCDAGWKKKLADDEEACPDCKDHRCVNEFFSNWCETCLSGGIVKINAENE